MGFPQPQFSVALIVFVLDSNGETQTVGGNLIGAGELVSAISSGSFTRGTATGAEIGDLLRAAMQRQLPGQSLSSRFRPLMPRFHRRDSIVLPFWTAGRMGDARVSSHRGGMRFDALERLAAELDDRALVREAISEFRRALAADPMANQLIGEGARSRALAMDECDRVETHSEQPPVVALLPERFTIDQLRKALSSVAHVPDREIEKSSNFRRRVAEFLEAGVLVLEGRVAEVEGSGRPPQLYMFDDERWGAWLRRKSDGAPVREAHRSPPMSSMDSFKMLPRIASNQFTASEVLGFSEKIATRAFDDTTEDSDRVANLEAMVRRLASQVDDLARARTAAQTPSRDDER